MIAVVLELFKNIGLVGGITIQHQMGPVTSYTWGEIDPINDFRNGYLGL